MAEPVASTPTISVVTSCSQSGFDKYGEHFLTTFLKYWPPEVHLYLVSEDPVEVPDNDGRVTFIPLDDSKGWNEFCSHHETDPRARVHAHVAKQYRHDAYKFCKKVFATELAAARCSSQRLLWLDADTVTFTAVPVAFLATLPSNGLPIAYLDRAPYHSECGFVGYNLEHPATRKFITEFARIYSSGEVFDLKEWNDCFVFDHLRKVMSLACYKIPHGSNMSHPFVHSPLGQFMDHLKGKRKDKGHSLEHPMFRRKGNPQPVIRRNPMEVDKQVVKGIYLPIKDSHFRQALLGGRLVDGKGTYQLKKIEAAIPHVKQFGTALDIGAHVGLWTRILATRFDHVHAFEPAAINAACFERNLALTRNVTLHRFALGATNGLTGIESVVDNSGNTHVRDLADTAVTLHCLDHVAASLGITQVDFIKIDVEGYEHNVVRGAADLIKRCKPTMVVEQKPGNAERYGSKTGEVIDLLKSWGASTVWERAGDYCMVWG